jgi:hypothetical protein
VYILYVYKNKKVISNIYILTYKLFFFYYIV